MSSPALHARSLYRRFLRELPSRTPSILANPSLIQSDIRDQFQQSQSASSSLGNQAEKPSQLRLEETEQFIHYLKAQRTYLTLLERYNPGMNMNEEEKVRLTGRRVGMELPVEYSKDTGKDPK